jgi:hypothetical protein
MKVQIKRSQQAVWCNNEAAQILGLSQSTLKNLRLTDQLVEGIYWVRFSSRCVRYNVELIKDWAATRTESSNHDQAVANFLSSLLSNQQKTRGRKVQKLSV